MNHIFISHVEEDADIALEIALGLETEGYLTWCYEIDCVPGPSYLIQTGQAIDQAESVILIISPHSLGSRQVTKEVVRTHESGKHFIPILTGITHIEFQNRQPEWREAIGAATSIRIPQEGVGGIHPRIIAGLKALDIQPKSDPNIARIDQITRILEDFQPQSLTKEGLKDGDYSKESSVRETTKPEKISERTKKKEKSGEIKDKKDAAINEYKIEDVQKPDAEEWNRKGKSLIDLKKYEEAIECFDKSLKINPWFADAWGNKGVVLLTLDKLHDALECIDKELEINPKEARGWLNRGLVLEKLGRHEEKIKAYQNAIKYSENTQISKLAKGRLSEALLFRGNTLRDLGKFEDAVAFYDEAIELNFRDADAWYNKGLALGKQGKYEEALTCYEKELEINPGDIKTYQEALVCYDRKLKINPKDTRIWLSKGKILEDLGRPEEALDCFDKAIEINPRSAEVWYSKGHILNKIGEFQDALEAYEHTFKYAQQEHSELVLKAREDVQHIKEKIRDNDQAGHLNGNQKNSFLKKLFKWG